MWSRMQRQYRRNLFSKSPLRRVAALGYLRARPTVNTAQLLREYIAWEPRSDPSPSRREDAQAPRVDAVTGAR